MSKHNRDRSKATEVPPELMQAVEAVQNGSITPELQEKLNAFCNVFSVVQLDGAQVPVLKPHLGFIPGGQYEEFMDFDYLVEEAGLRKFVRPRFASERDLSSDYVAVAVLRPGIRSREAADLYKLDQN